MSNNLLFFTRLKYPNPNQFKMSTYSIFLSATFMALLVVRVNSQKRPNYLTEDDFTRAELLLPSTVPNGTIFTSPNNSMELQRETRSAWRYGKWPSGRIPYTLDPTFNTQQRALVAQAFNNYHRKTCIRFEPRRGKENAYVQILKDDNTCGLAETCRKGRAQFAKFGGECISSGVMTHELGHTICFGHEQSRSDRDDYISWNKNVCTPHGIDSKTDWTTLDLFYDYVSIQHYEGECYNGCIRPKISGVTKCGSGGDLSVLDVEKINAFYDCRGCYSYRFRPMAQLQADENFVPAGTDINGQTLYSCRVYHNGDIVPGTGDPKRKFCYVSYNGTEHKYGRNFEILTNPKGANLQWRPRSSDGSFPSNAIPGGRSAEREPLYIGRCTLTLSDGKKTTVSGKFHRSASEDLYVPFGGGEYKCRNYEILVCQ